MIRRILLLRGVNVGGVVLPMAGLRAALEGLGLARVRSHIQSGNAVFDDPGLPDLQAAIAGAIAARFGLTPALFLYTPPEFAAIIAECPFQAEGEARGAALHVFFLSAPVSPDLGALQALSQGERFHLTPRAFYLLAEAGIGRSKLAEALPRQIGTAQTARNWNTVRALAALAAD